MLTYLVSCFVDLQKLLNMIGKNSNGAVAK